MKGWACRGNPDHTPSKKIYFGKKSVSERWSDKTGREIGDKGRGDGMNYFTCRSFKDSLFCRLVPAKLPVPSSQAVNDVELSKK